MARGRALLDDPVVRPYATRVKRGRVTGRIQSGVASALLLVASGCSFGQGALLARASSDLSCPEEQLESRCVVASKGRWVVTGCGRYAQYVKTSAGPRIEHIGDGKPPSEEQLCAKGF